MQSEKHKKIEYSVASLSETRKEGRIDSDYYDVEYLKNEEYITRNKWEYVENKLVMCDYGLSIAMNDEKVGYRILKMDDIIDIFAYDDNCKYADISRDLFENYKLSKNDILFNRVNSEEFVGRTGIYLLDDGHTFASYLIRLRYENPWRNFYTTIFLNTKYGKKCLRRVSRRAVNQANINAEELKKIKMPIPSEGFQKTIQKLVVLAYAEKKTSETKYREAEKILLDDIGLDDFPSLKNSKSDYSVVNLTEISKRDRFDSEYWEKRYQDVLEKIKNYRNGYDSLDGLIDISDKKIQPEGKQIYNYIELADINSNYGVVEQTQEILGSDLPSRARMPVKPGNILMSSIEGSIDKIAIVDFEKENLLASTGFFVFGEKNAKKLNKETILVLLKVLSERFIIREAQGTILTSIPNSSLSIIQLPKIESEIQKKVKLKIEDSLSERKKSKKILEIAIRAVELFIEENEDVAFKFIKERILNVGPQYIL